MSKHPDLRVRVVHGNTLTAAVILNEIPKDVKEVFLTGATSKLGRAIALYLCRKKIRVLVSYLHMVTPYISLISWLIIKEFTIIQVSIALFFKAKVMCLLTSINICWPWQMLTLSAERFQKIQKEAPPECQHYLVQVTKYQAAQSCKVYLVDWIFV